MNKPTRITTRDDFGPSMPFHIEGYIEVCIASKTYQLYPGIKIEGKYYLSCGEIQPIYETDELNHHFIDIYRKKFLEFNYYTKNGQLTYFVMKVGDKGYSTCMTYSSDVKCSVCSNTKIEEIDNCIRLVGNICEESKKDHYFKRKLKKGIPFEILIKTKGKRLLNDIFKKTKENSKYHQMGLFERNL